MLEKQEVMNRILVNSTTISSVGYNADTLVLEVEFINGALYKYLDVPATVYLRFMNADSKGQFYNYYIRDVYDYERVNDTIA